jgi:hypothetical protein
MAKITITIEDTSDGKVSVVAKPNFEAMMKMDLSGETMTSAHGYALYALNCIRTEAKRQSPTPLLIPSVRRQ